MNARSMYPTHFIPILLILLLTSFSELGVLHDASAQEAEEVDPAEITNGERLFLETRFAQFFKVFLDNGGDVNSPLPLGDAALDKVVNWNLQPDQFTDGPFAGQSMNCRSCHFVDEQLDVAQYGMRTYTDFAGRSPVPAREDGHQTTVRNSPPLVNASLERKNFFLHFDAEFATMTDLVKGTLTGRNYGYLANERTIAIAHIARIIREDDGTGELAQEFGGLSYAILLTGTDPTIPEEFLLPEEFRLDVSQATNQQIFHAISQLIGAYTEDLAFSQDEEGNFNLSPYDVFLEKNRLPRQPKKWESPEQYSRRLTVLIDFLEESGALEFVTSNPNSEDGKFQFHAQPFVFGEEELRGLKIFFARRNRPLRPSDLARGGIGNCIACHTAPNFTDFEFHNTGIAQMEYDQIHGSGAFKALHIPGLGRRNRNPEAFLPATSRHPNAQEPFRSIPGTENPQLTDLGVWNIFWNPDFPKSQFRLWTTLCENALDGRRPKFWNIIRFCLPDRLLQNSIAVFKTPGLRDLGHSAPYSHVGIADTLEKVILGYKNNSELARQKDLRNGDDELKRIALIEEDIPPLAAFLKALNEDYE
ncbi:MAG: hypothetical protein AB7P17_01405 [Nitrospirales bacterium]|nr:hypothetical protein [Nitrospirales bacterium]